MIVVTMMDGGTDKMNKKLLIAALIISPVIYAQGEDFSKANPDDFRGIRILSKDQLFAKSDPFIKQHIASKGYIENDGKLANYLSNIKENAANQIDEGTVLKYPEDTRMKKSFNEIKLNFKFNGVNSIPKESIYGYAPIGSMDKEGKWDGIMFAFNDKTLGNCEYSREKIVGVQLDRDEIEYKVNGNPSDATISGNPKDGFVHAVEWYTQEPYAHTLECVSPTVDKTMIADITVLASKIDIDMKNQ